MLQQSGFGPAPRSASAPDSDRLGGSSLAYESIDGSQATRRAAGAEAFTCSLQVDDDGSDEMVMSKEVYDSEMHWGRLVRQSGVLKLLLRCPQLYLSAGLHSSNVPQAGHPGQVCAALPTTAAGAQLQVSAALGQPLPPALQETPHGHIFLWLLCRGDFHLWVQQDGGNGKGYSIGVKMTVGCLLCCRSL